MLDKPIVRPYVKRYGLPRVGFPIKWAAAIIIERWAPLHNGHLYRKEFICEDKEANFATKREAEAWAYRRASEIRETLT